MKNNKGFAFVEVLLAALVLSIGIAAFLRLQSMNLKISNNNYSRTQALLLSSSFVEQLRANTTILSLKKNMRTGGFAGGTDIGSLDGADFSKSCTSNEKECAKRIFRFQKQEISDAMGQAFPAGLSLMCFSESPDILGYIKVTFLWRDSMSKSRTKDIFKSDNCPTFSGAVGAVDRESSVTTYVQI